VLLHLQVRAIQSYEGAVVVASHDLRFVQDVVAGPAAAAACRSPDGGPDSSASVRPQPEAQPGQQGGEVYVLKGSGGISRWLDDGGVMAYARKVLAKVVRQQGGLLQQQ
jgi:hypothetical protein